MIVKSIFLRKNVRYICAHKKNMTKIVTYDISENLVKKFAIWHASSGGKNSIFVTITPLG